MTFDVEQIAFWLSIAVLGYVYLGYPLLVWVVGHISQKPVVTGMVEPKVTVLITAFNEELSIGKKLENTLALEYPAEKLEILVASDGSTDSTDALVDQFRDRGVRLFRQEGRVGKTITQNNAVEAATGEVVVFSDATTMYRKDALKELLPAFADQTVGCVAGRLIYVDASQSNVGKGARSYWGYETFIKIAESRACSLIGASGCLYAVRKSAYEPMYAEACSDFLISSILYRKGLRTVFAPKAICYEATNSDTDNELNMRVRVILQTINDLWRNRDMLSPVKSGFFAIELISHKLLRYAVPVLLLLILITNAVLAPGSIFYSVTLVFQAVFYLAALAGWLMERTGWRITLLAMPSYFVLANAASLVAFFRFVRGDRMARWEPARDT
jgi:cellulose synthase/poly-beta-1,6-N-acetylglucosamine synthase-like glycosyltransferase